jgi:hypothetical protein
VIAPTMVDAVRAAGGWLFDSGLAGWDAMVLVADDCDSRPLRILGARTGDLEAALKSRVHGPRPHALAVDGDLYDSDLRIQRLVLRLLDIGLTEVRLWGRDWPADVDDESSLVCHRLSMAARAFKTQALTAATESAEPIDSIEMFHCGEMLSVAPEGSELVSV